MALILGGKVQHITIDPDDDDGPERYGDTKILWRRSGITEKEFAQKAVQVSLAGPVAEMIYTGDPFHPGLVPEWADDWRLAWESAAPLHPEERQRLLYLEQASIQLHRQLNDDELWSALAAVADHLLAHETLEGEEVEEIVAEWLSPRF